MTTAIRAIYAELGNTVRRFHRRMPGYAPTPLRTLPSFSGEHGPQVLVKDESSRLGLPAFKILGASWAVYRKIETTLGITLDDWNTFDELVNLVQPLRPCTLIAATDGNHGRAVARMAKLLGFKSRIFLPKGTVDGRINGIASEGAEVIEVDGTFDEAVEHAADAAATDDQSWLILDTSTHGDESIARWVIEGYATMMLEIDDDIARTNASSPSVVFVQIGVGALAAAVVRHSHQPDRSVRPMIIGVEAKCAPCAEQSIARGELVSVPGPHDSIMAGLNCGTLSGVAWPELRDGLSGVIAVDDAYPRRAMQAASKDGIVMGESGAASFAGLIDLLENPERSELRDQLNLGPSSTVLVFNTEGATDPVSYEAIVGDNVTYV